MNNLYKKTMDKLQFSNNFNGDTVMLLKEVQERQSKKKYLVRGIAAACAAVAVFASLPSIMNMKADNQQNPDASANVTSQAVEPTFDNSTAQKPKEEPALDKAIVKSSDYSVMYTADSLALAKGEVYVYEHVKTALDDPANADGLFFVQINLITPYSYEHSFDDYVYNGRTLAEWAVLVDLANDTYPYSEYNGDFGGDVSEAEWEQAKQEAKTLNAQENYNMGYEEYLTYEKTTVTPMIEKEETVEFERLKAAGYDVMIYENWAYEGEGERVNYPILAGLLSKEQIENFNVSNEYGYVIDWITNGDGQVIDWTGK